MRERRLGELANQVASLSAEMAGARDAEREQNIAMPYAPRLTFKSGDRTIVLKAEEIIWIEAEDYYVLIHSVRGRHLVRIPMATFEEKLDPTRFARVHRAALVNLAEVKEYRNTDGAMLLISDGANVAVSRARRKRVEELLLPRPA